MQHNLGSYKITTQYSGVTSLHPALHWLTAPSGLKHGHTTAQLWTFSLQSRSQHPVWEDNHTPSRAIPILPASIARSKLTLRSRVTDYRDLVAMDSAIAAHELLQYLRFGYPPVVLVVIFVVFLVHSSKTAKNASRNTKVQYGPGGKPLPSRTRMMMAVARNLPAELERNRCKGWFIWLSLFVLATYTAEAAIHMTHAIISKSEQWWCGQAVVVGLLFQKLKPKLTK